MKLRADRRVGLLLAGVVLLTFVAIGATVALPASDTSLRGDGTDMSAAQEEGMKIYRSEGCWYCHTQYLRNSGSEVGAGTNRPLDPADYEGRSPSMLGLERFGPDLTYGGSMDETTLMAFLNGEQDGHEPAYGYLSDADLEALAAYLLSSR
ncbi:MAG: c-type cytochrome [Actinomycetota bacterium]